MRIRYVKHADIDKARWDGCIRNSGNRKIYARSVYLDAMAAGWDALVGGDYETVMPLCFRKKWGIAYLYQPAFVQQLGIFAKEELPQETQESFLTEARRHFKFAELTMNSGNDIGATAETARRQNCELPLQGSYENIRDAYDSIAQKNLKRAAHAGLRYEFSAHYLPVLKAYKKRYGHKQPSVQLQDYLNFASLCDKLFQENNLLVRRVIDTEGKLMAACVMPLDGNRIYNLVSIVQEEGKSAQANYFLFDQLIREFCGSNFVLDFEGSDVPGIAAFYKHFSPKTSYYPFVKWNDLPAFVKLFKK